MMLEEKLQKLSAKESIDGSDAFAVLQLLQDHTIPILSRRSVGISPAASSCLHPSSRLAKSSGLEGRSTCLGSCEDGRRHNSSRDVSLKRALFDQKTSPGERQLGTVEGCSTASIPNVNSLQDFPPMQSITTRKKDKRSSKPRRITLTSMQQKHHHSHTSHMTHFTPPPPASDKWSPAFVVEVTTSSGACPLSEERRLLMRERSKQMKSRNGGGCGGRDGGSTNYSRMPGATPCRSDTRPLDSDGHLSTSEQQLTEHSGSPQQSTDEVCVALTSTPVADSLAIRTQCGVSVDRVSNREILDDLAQLYSKMITDRMVPNLTSEIHFVVQLLTCTQPVTPTQSVSGSEYLFDTVENSVYFAVRVLFGIKSMLTALDKATLQLLCENVRIKQLEPQLAVFLSGALETASEGSNSHRPPAQYTFTRVPFREETDNVKNFPNMKVFHAFKKQRDSFYSILREWEACHDTPNWNFRSALRDKIRLLMRQPPELCSLDHLATLFQKQLLESCGYAAYISAGVGELVEGPLKNLNPDKLMRLSERFLRQSHVSTGICPPPAFTQSEQFFSNFVISADSYIFNHHLSTVLRHELLKLQSRCECVAVKDVPEILHALRVLAKFLGYLDFLPYSSIISPSLLPARTASPHLSMISECVQEATEKGHLSLTIPWAVDYMSMMDTHALQVTQCHTLLHQLITVYRSCLVEGDGVTVETFLVLTTLGWLFEIPNVPNSIFFEDLRTNSPPLNPSHADTQSELVTREVLYTCCPYLAGVRVLLAEFAAGLQSKTSPIRKIKPIPAGSTTSHSYSTPSSQLQVKLQDNFFRNHPPVLKQLCDSVSERVAETSIQLVQSQVFPEHVRRALRVLASWLGKTSSEHHNADSSINIEELFHKHEAVQHVAEVSEQAFSSVLRDATHLCQKHSETNTKTAVNSMLCDTISKQVMEVAVGIATNWAMDQCMKWLHGKLRGIVFQEVSSGFDRLRKAVRAGGRAQLSTASSLNSTSQHLPSLNDGCSLNTSRVENSFSSQRSLESCKQHVPCTGPSSLLSQFIELASSILSDNSPSRERVMSVTRATADVKDLIAAEVVVVEGGYSPLLLPADVDNLLSLSVQLVALLVARGLARISCDCDSRDLVFVEQITSLWSLLKGLKQEIPIDILLCADSVTCYLQQEEQGVEDVWCSLTCLLIESIKLSIVTTDVLEALWLCRIKQTPTHQRRGIVNGAAVFLAMWYGQGQGEKDEPQGIFREVCFVRLLSTCIVVSDSDTPSIAALKNHPSLTFLSL